MEESALGMREGCTIAGGVCKRHGPANSQSVLCISKSVQPSQGGDVGKGIRSRNSIPIQSAASRADGREEEGRSASGKVTVLSKKL
eukprot:scaffold1022_cov115-Skeletonema_dohrnii-CCMP3373.AAC.3